MPEGESVAAGEWLTNPYLYPQFKGQQPAPHSPAPY